MVLRFLGALIGLWAVLFVAPVIYAIATRYYQLGLVEWTMQNLAVLLLCHALALLLAMAIFKTRLTEQAQITGHMRWLAFMPFVVSGVLTTYGIIWSQTG